MTPLRFDRRVAVTPGSGKTPFLDMSGLQPLPYRARHRLI